LKVLLLDIEISPTLAAVWGLWNQNIGIPNIIGNSEVLTWAAAWHGEEDVICSGLHMTSKRKMLREVYNLLEQADVVVSYNGDRFDLKILNQEFMMQGWTPPAPYKSVDLLKVMKKHFRGTSNKLDYWLKRLHLGAKHVHRGPQLWLDCVNGDRDAFEEMIEYNIGDVVELEKLFDRVRPWIHNMPSLVVMDGECKCPQCGSRKYQKRGWYFTNQRKYQRYKCSNIECGKWFRDTRSQPLDLEHVFVGVPA
jgi:hypothetical protein